jgi:phage terminase large subunit
MTTLSLADQYQFIWRCRDDPEYFWKYSLGSNTVYPKQLEMAEAIRNHNRVAVVGANGTGKDWQAARIMLWWQSVHYPAITVVIGPTHRQVSDIVWKEARSSFLDAAIPLDGQMYKTTRWEYDDRHYAVGFSTDNEFNIQGFHSPNLLVIVTEAHNVEQSHIEAVKRLNPARMLLTGNAFASSGEFYDAFHGGSDLYHTIKISAADTPNIQQGREIIPGMVTAEQVEERRREWGEESAMYIASVLGRFPDNLEDAIVPRSLLMEAVERELEPVGEARLACDVARFGADKTVVYRRQGNVCRLVWKIQGRNTQEVAGRLKAMAEDDPDVTEIIVDDTGVGGGVTDRLNEENVAEGRVRIVAFNGGEKARRSDRYVNAIAEAWLELGQTFRDGTIDIDDNPAVIAQLSARRYTVQGDRRIKLESKDDFKKRSSGGSPDDADALAMCYAAPGPGVGVW